MACVSFPPLLPIADCHVVAGKAVKNTDLLFSVRDEMLYISFLVIFPLLVVHILCIYNLLLLLLLHLLYSFMFLLCSFLVFAADIMPRKTIKALLK